MSLTVTYCFLFNVLILTSQTVAFPLNIISKILCKMAKGTLGAVKYVKDNVKTIAKCISCGINTKRQELKTFYAEFINQTLEKILFLFPPHKLKMTILSNYTTESSEDITDATYETETETFTSTESETETAAFTEMESTPETVAFTEADSKMITPKILSTLITTAPSTRVFIYTPSPITVKTPTPVLKSINVPLPRLLVFVSPNPITLTTKSSVTVSTPMTIKTTKFIKTSRLRAFVSPNPITVTTLTTLPTRTTATSSKTMPTRTTVRSSATVAIPKKVMVPQRTGNGSYIVRRMSLPINKDEKINDHSEKNYGTSLQLDLVRIHGYKTEIHTVVTPDGYLLTIHRIISKSKFKGKYKNKTAILLHGLLGSSMDWILLGPKLSLAYMLIDAGYDVWLPNVRGNAYSRAHVSKSVHSADYWDFSWHEIGLYDLSSTIDYIREKISVKSQIIFIAHSMGATALMVLLSTSPRYNMVLSFVVLLAPLVFMQQAKGPLRLLSEFKNLDYNATVKILGGHEFIPVESFMRVAKNKFCRDDIIMCLHPLFLLTDGGKSIKNNIHKKNILTNFKAAGSVKTILHFCQLIKSGQFEMYDLGSSMNLKKYGTVSPPKYHVRDIKLPIAIFNSHNDWLSTVPDILNLLSHLPNTVNHHVVQLSSIEFNHLDFVLGLNAPKLVYKHIFEVLDQLF